MNIDTMTMLERQKHSIFRRPSPSDPALQRAYFHVKTVGPLCNRQSFSTDVENTIIRYITHLSFSINPSTIGWAIISIIINSINTQIVSITMIIRPFREYRETITPRITDMDTSRTINPIFNLSGIVASGFHTGPYFIQPGLALSMCSMIALGLQASAAFCFSIAKSHTIYKRDLTTRTKTFIDSPSVDSSAMLCENGQSSECFVYHRDYFRHAAILEATRDCVKWSAIKRAQQVKNGSNMQGQVG